MGSLIWGKSSSGTLRTVGLDGAGSGHAGYEGERILSDAI